MGWIGESISTLYHFNFSTHCMDMFCKFKSRKQLTDEAKIKACCLCAEKLQTTSEFHSTCDVGVQSNGQYADPYYFNFPWNGEKSRLLIRMKNMMASCINTVKVVI